MASLKTQVPIVCSPLGSVQQKYFLVRVGLLEIIIGFLEMPFNMKHFFWAIFFYASNLMGQVKISDAIALAKQKNPMVKSYAFNAEIQKSDIQTAKQRPNLLFNQQSIFLLDRKSLDLIQPNADFFVSPYASQLWFQVTKQYQIGGKRKAKIQFQTNEYEFAQRDAEQYANDIAYQSALKWLDAWYAKVGMDIILQAENNLDTLLQINRVRLKNQVITKNELTRTQILDEQYNTFEFAARQKYRTELKKLAYMIGSQDTINIDFADDFFFKDIPDEIDSLIRYAIDHRPDVLSNQAQLKISNGAIALNKSLSYPNPEFGLVYNPQNRQPYVGWYFQMPIPIFDRNQGAIQRSKVEFLQAETQLQVTKDRLKTEISYTIDEYETYKGNSERYREIEEDADIVLRTVRYTYLRGGTSIVDY